MGIRKTILICLVGLFLVSSIPGIVSGNEASKGVILGHIYSFDGTTPIKGAVIKVINTSSRNEHMSSVSDENGLFNITGIESGIYMYSVSVPEGNYVADDVFGVKVSENDTARISISITPYDERVESVIAEASPAPEIEGETFIGRVIEFDESSGEAGIFVMQNVLKKNDRIHALGDRTDFYQKVKNIKIEDNDVNKVDPGKTATIKLEIGASPGDAVYVADNKGGSILPFILGASAGVATIVGGSKVVAYKMGTAINEQVRATSGFKTKR